MNKKITDRFWITSDSNNLILVDKCGVKPRYRYFPNIKLLSHCIVELETKESLGKHGVSLGDFSSLAQSYDAVMKDIALKLEGYLQTIIGDNL